MDIGTAIALIALVAFMCAPIIIDEIAKSGLFNRRNEHIKDLEKRVKELEKGSK